MESKGYELWQIQDLFIPLYVYYIPEINIKRTKNQKYYVFNSRYLI